MDNPLEEQVRQCVCGCLSIEPFHRLVGESTVDALIRLILRSPYRRSSIGESSAEDVHRKVTEALTRQDPIRFSVPFGCYKLWRLSASPWPDWAEVFWLVYLMSYVAPIAAAYRGGTSLELTYCSIGVEEANCLLEGSIERYAIRLQSILNCCLNRSPIEGLEVRLFDVAQLYAGDEGQVEFERNVAYAQCEWFRSIPPETCIRMQDSAARNLHLPVGCEGGDAVDAIRTSAQRIHAVDSLKRRRWFNKYSDRIQLVHVKGPEPAVHVGTCRTSTCHPNVGSGILHQVQSNIYGRIISAAGLAETVHSGVIRVGDIWPELVAIDERFREIDVRRNGAG